MRIKFAKWIPTEADENQCISGKSSPAALIGEEPYAGLSLMSNTRMKKPPSSKAPTGRNIPAQGKEPPDAALGPTPSQIPSPEGADHMPAGWTTTPEGCRNGQLSIFIHWYAKPRDRRCLRSRDSLCRLDWTQQSSSNGEFRSCAIRSADRTSGPRWWNPGRD